MIPPPALKERSDLNVSALLFLKEILPRTEQRKQVVG